MNAADTAIDRYFESRRGVKALRARREQLLREKAEHEKAIADIDAQLGDLERQGRAALKAMHEAADAVAPMLHSEVSGYRGALLPGQRDMEKSA